MANQDGNLAVRVLVESASGVPRGPTSCFDDEGITFTTKGNATFDVRDLVSGVQRGDQFDVVGLGTSGADNLIGAIRTQAYYMNGGAGNDRLFGGFMNDFLVGGRGNDFISDRWGDNTFIGGGGDDLIFSGAGDDTVTVNLATDGRDKAELVAGLDTVNVAAPGSAGQILLTFTSAEVGNGNARDSRAMANQDGSLAVRMDAENGADGLSGLTSRYDDEGIKFVSMTAGVTFDVRDLVSGVQRGDKFNVVQLGTSGNDTIYGCSPT
jgi:Ca2+-binding RTX toxin-like protein